MEKEIQTYSIIGYDPESKSWGVAVASKWLAVGNNVPYAKAGVGAIATQAYTNSSYGPRGLELLAQGKSATEVLDALLSEDPDKEKRQVGILDTNGNAASFTGSGCIPEAGSLLGPNCAVQGNTLLNKDVLEAMKATFEGTQADLAHKLYAALLAGEKAGGEKRGKQSAALLVVKEGAGFGGFSDKYVDLRVDDNPEPVVELGRLLELHPQYHFTFE